MAFENLLSSLTGGSSAGESAPAENTSAIAGAGKCPNCSNNLFYKRGEKVVTCNCCDQVVDVNDIVKGGASAAAGDTFGGGINVASVAMTIDSPESGLVYVENFFENYNWTAYKLTSTIGIEEVDGMVEKNKIKNGANASAWVLDFESKSIPLAKKVEGLKEIEESIVKVYDPVDTTKAFSLFDAYKRIARALVACKASAVKQLESDIKYAEKYGADAAKCADMSARLASLKAALDTVAVPSSIDRFPAVIKAKDAINAKVASALAAKGIDAVATYKEAVRLFDTGDKRGALSLFEAIKRYADSADYVERINKYFNYNYTLFSVFGKHYIFKEDTAPTYNPNDKGANNNNNNNAEAAAAEESNGPTLALYEVVGGEPAEKPLFKGLSQLLKCYGNKIFYISKNKKICCFDIDTNEEIVLDEGKNKCYQTIGGEYDTYLANDGKAIFMRKRLELKAKKEGCFASIKDMFSSLFGKKKEEPVRKDNYSIIYIDLATNEVKTIVDELIDITEYYDNSLFYVTADKDPKSEATYFMVCDLQTFETKRLLDDNCDVHTVFDGKVVYSIWTPNDYNKDLYVMDIKTGVNTLIETNVYNFFRAINGRVYYTVGNDDYCPLFSNNTEGTDRLEIMKNVEDLTYFEGWLYAFKGSGLNTALVKISLDGKQRFVVCTQLKEIVDFVGNYVYYIDTSSVLRVVRNDGKDNRAIASGMSKKNVIVESDVIYYLRRENVTSRKKAFSLYKMDISGNNPKKLIFNVDSFKDYDRDTLYLMRKENVKFEITTPISAKETNTEYKTFAVTRYFSFDKNNEKLKTVLSLGLPKTGKYEFKSGCLGKKVEAESTYRVVPDKSEFKRSENVASQGAVFNSQVNDANNAAPAPANQGCGCSK